MICQRCFLRLRFRPQGRALSTSSPFSSAANPPAATSTSAAQPFSTPFSPSPARDPEYQDAVSQPKPSESTGKTAKQAPIEIKSSVKAGTVLKGLGYLKGKEAPVAKEDHEYPDWLWGLLDKQIEKRKEGAAEGDLYGLSLLFAAILPHLDCVYIRVVQKWTLAADRTARLKRIFDRLVMIIFY